MHGREAAMLVKLERAFEAELTLECGGRSTNAKSIMGILALDCANGAEWIATAEGPDADRLIGALEQLFAGGFSVAEDFPAGAASGRGRMAAEGGRCNCP